MTGAGLDHEFDVDAGRAEHLGQRLALPEGHRVVGVAVREVERRGAAVRVVDRTGGVRGVIDWYGPSDLFAMEEYTRALGVDAPGESREDRWLGGWVKDVPDAAHAASPVNHVHRGAPPFHLAHGDADDAVPLGQSQALADVLSAAGVDVELVVESGAGHFWRDAAPDRVALLFDRAIEFSRRVTA